MATIIETYEANTRMMKQNNGMLQEVLRQLKLLSVQLGIFDGGDISDTREILTKQDDPSIMVNQVFDKLPTTNEELARDRGVDTANQAENATPTDKSKKVSLYNYDQTEVFPFIGVMNNANKEGNEGVEKGKALIIASAGYDDQLLVSRLMGQTSNLKDSNMIFGDNANPIQSNMVGTSNLNLTLREIWDSYLHLMGTVPIKEMMSIDLVKGAKVPVSAENAYSMRRMLGPPQVQLGLVTSFQIIVMVVELGTGDQGNRYHDSWIVMNFDPGGISIAKISNGDNLLYNNGGDSGATFLDDNYISAGGKTVKKDATVTHEILKDIIGLLKQSSCLAWIFSCCVVICKCTGSHYESSDQQWLNNCTGKWNYIQFFTLSDLLLLILQWSTGILVHICWGHSSSNLEDKVLLKAGIML